MNIKRVVTTLIGLPIVAIALNFANKYIIGCIMTAVAICAMYEYIKCTKEKDVKVIKWISYLSTLIIAIIHVIPVECFAYGYYFLPLLMIVLFAHVIFTDMKYTVEDIACTLFGIIYVVGFISFFALIFGYHGSISGKMFIWFVIAASWGTDIFAYLTGKHFGKTKFSKISPNKSIEGCIGGTLAAVIISILFAIGFNYFFHVDFSLLQIGFMGFVLSIMGQLGDFSASAIKRYFGVKDFSDLFPGHGGMIDRIDSVMFVAPIAFIFLVMMF